MFRNCFKNALIATAIASLSLPALAGIQKESKNGYSWLTSTSLQSVLKAVGAGEGYKIEGQKMRLEGWLAAVETTKANDGTTLFVLQISDTFSVDLPGLTRNSAYPGKNLTFLCVSADRSKVQKLNVNQLVTFNAEIREIKANSHQRNYGSTKSGAQIATTVKQSSVIATCEFTNDNAGQPISSKAAPAQASSATVDGQYTNGKVTITLDEGPRGGTDLSSSLCKGKIFRPRYDAKTEMLTDDKGVYAISFGGEYMHMEIESSEKCLPEGRYRKAK